MKIKISKDPNVIAIQKISSGFCLTGNLDGEMLWCIDVIFDKTHNRWNDPVLYYQGNGITNALQYNLSIRLVEDHNIGTDPIYELLTCNPNLRIVFADDTVQGYIANMVRAHGANWIIERLRRFNLTHRQK